MKNEVIIEGESSKDLKSIKTTQPKADKKRKEESPKIDKRKLVVYYEIMKPKFD